MFQAEGTALQKPGGKRGSKELRIQKAGRSGPFPRSQIEKGKARILTRAELLQAWGSLSPTWVDGSAFAAAERRGCS